MTDSIDPIERVDQETQSEYDSLDDREYYAVRVVFVSDRSDDDRHVVTMPWLTFDSEHAHHVAYHVVSDPVFGSLTFAAWLSSGDVDLPDDRQWQPLAARVVRLASVPF